MNSSMIDGESNNSCPTESWYKNALAKPPVPDLEHTLQRFLEYARVVADSDHDKVRRTEAAVAAFKPSAAIAQQKLRQIADNEDNWINRFWLNEMYLKPRVPLPVNVNPAICFPQQTFKNLDEQLTKLIPRDKSTGKEKVEICMEQFERMMRCYREADIPVDVQHFDQTVAKPHGDWNEHIVVMCNNRTFVAFTRLAGRLLTASEIAAQLEKVVQMSKESKLDDGTLPIGSGNVGNRNDAAKFWRLMKQYKRNRDSLDWIRNASFVLCIDFGEAKVPGAVVDPVNRLEHTLHGHGSQASGLNRWYEATLQLIVADNGTNSLCVEHSVAEGIVICKLVEYAIEFVRRNLTDKTFMNMVEVTKPFELQWKTPPEAKKIQQIQIETFDKLVNDLSPEMLNFEEFGREFIKSCNFSPDGFVQLSMQLAHYRVHGYLVSTYESASIRRFRKGRVDNIRAATPEALCWVKTMLNEGKSKKEKREAFEVAAKKQATITLENVTGHGIDNHLCALNVLIAEDVANGRLDRMPDIFIDPLYKETMRFPLSTSQVSTTIGDIYLGYGPVVADGYGCSYDIHQNLIKFTCTSFKSCPRTDTSKFKQGLVQSLRDLKALIT